MYSDAAFATIDDLSSQLGYNVLLVDSSNRCHVLDYASKTSERIVRSIVGGETYAFLDVFEIVHTLRDDMQRLLGRHSRFRHIQAPRSFSMH